MLYRYSLNMLILVLGLGLGWLSARYMMENATAATGSAANNWQEIRIGGDGLTPTYQAAQFLLRGQVPPPSNVRVFKRETDDEGNALRADCAVTVEGPAPDARWWFVATESGDADSALLAGEMIRESNGDFIATVSSHPMPGNWLAPAAPGKYVLRLVIEDAIEEDGKPKPIRLPSVKKLWC